jgi:Uma2 family endonuclease
VICGTAERDPESPTHVTNPKLVVEVLSPGTAAYDRGEKLAHYQRVPSLEAVVLFDHGRDLRGGTRHLSRAPFWRCVSAAC